MTTPLQKPLTYSYYVSSYSGRSGTPRPEGANIPPLLLRGPSGSTTAVAPRGGATAPTGEGNLD